MFEQDLVASRHLVDHELQILGEKVATFYQPLSFPSRLRKVLGLRGVALADREARVAQSLAVPPRCRKPVASIPTPLS
jgi:hypothetical protein